MAMSNLKEIGVIHPFAKREHQIGMLNGLINAAIGLSVLAALWLYLIPMVDRAWRGDCGVGFSASREREI